MKADRWRRESATAVRTLVACGWLTPAEAGDPRLTITDSSSAHSVSCVTAPDGRTAVVKQLPREAAEAGRSLLRELYVYRMAKWIPALADLLPEPVFIDERQQVIVLESLAAGQSTGVTQRGICFGSPGVAAQLGRAMATWHRVTTEVALWPSLAVGVLHMPDALGVASDGHAPNTQELMRSIASDAELAAGLRETRTGYRPQCLIHGDVRRENWMMKHGGEEGTLKILDWEMSGAGDPAWDIGSVLAESLLDPIRTDIGGPAGAGLWPEEHTSQIGCFVRAYVAAGGAGVDEREPDAWDHVTLCASARLLHIGCEWAERGADTRHGPIQAIVATARELLRRRAEIAAVLRGWASP